MSEIHSQFFTSNLTEISRNYPFYCRLNSAGNNFFTKKTDIERRIIQGVFINAQSEIHYRFVETNRSYKFKRNVLKLPCQLKNLFSFFLPIVDKYIPFYQTGELRVNQIFNM